MRYFITIAFGVAALANYFGQTGSVCDIGQGATDDPPGWTSIIDVALKCYKRLAEECQMMDSTTLFTLRANLYMFEDNASHLHNDNNNAIEVRELMKNVCHDTETWGRLIWTTRGLLEFTNSLYAILAWKLTVKGQPLQMKESELPTNNV
eukprot:2402269-Ditylum_brightwellii.AAC.1